MNIPHWLAPAAIGGVVTWTLERLRMWNVFRKLQQELREAKLKADKAEIDLREFKSEIRRNREKREFDENLLLYIEAVKIAFTQIAKSHPLHPNTVPLSSLAKAVDMEQGTLRLVLKTMQETGRIEPHPSPFTQGEIDYTIKS